MGNWRIIKITTAILFLFVWPIFPQENFSGEGVQEAYYTSDYSKDDLKLEEKDYTIKPASKDYHLNSGQDKISLDLKGVDIREVFRVLSLKTGLTIVPSKGVSGRVNLFLNNVSFDDILDILLISQNLALEKKEGIIYVMTNSEYKQLYGKDYVEKRNYKSVRLKYAKPSGVFNAISQLKSDIGKIIVDEATGTIILIDIPEKLHLMQEVIEQLDQPLEMVVFDINYANLEKLKAQLQEVLTPGVGSIVIDDRSSKVIISDLPHKMEEIKRVMKALDEEERQVFIEAEIVQINLSERFGRGIDWERLFSPTDDSLDLIGKFPLLGIGEDIEVVKDEELVLGQRVSIGTIPPHKYKTVLDFLSAFGDVKVLSRPRIAVVNNQEAKIMVGRREAYISTTQSQAEATTVFSESIEFIDVGVKLNIVPTIGKDGFITMKIKPEISDVLITITTALGSRIPIVETSEAETTVKVKDGTIIMIAGLMRREKSNTLYGTPFLSQLPFLGAMFSKEEREDKKTELVVFIRPRLFRGDALVEGTEIEEKIPKEIMPQDIKKALVLKELERVRAELFEEKVDFILPEKKITPTLREKMKGIKKF
jgi:type II secretory pathway component GspD/PulD (secretin)